MNNYLRRLLQTHDRRHFGRCQRPATGWRPRRGAELSHFGPAALLMGAAALVASVACSSPLQTSDSTLITSPPLIIAHRGARSLAPENTLAAARKALDVGADMWELDVTITADDELVVMHDDTLERTCNAPELFADRSPWQVRDFSMAEIEMLDCGSWFNDQDPFGQIQAGNVSDAEQQSYAGEQAPTLRQALEFTRDHDWRVNVELKRQPTEALDQLLVQKAVALIGEVGMDDGQQVVVSSFRHDYLEHIRTLNPDIPTQAVTSTLIQHLPDYLSQLGASACNPKATVWSYKRMAQLQVNGVAFNVWTVNDDLTMRALVKTGVHGIITDFPQRLAQILSEQ